MGFWEAFDAVGHVDEATCRMLAVAGDVESFRHGAHYGDILPTLVLPSDIKAKADNLNGRYDSLELLTKHAPSGTLTPGFIAGWEQLLVRWKFAYASLTSTAAWFSQIWSPRAADDSLDQFTADYNTALAQYQAETGQQIAAGPAVTPPKPATTGDKVERVLLVTAAIATIVSVGYLINAAKK